MYLYFTSFHTCRHLFDNDVVMSWSFVNIPSCLIMISCLSICLSAYLPACLPAPHGNNLFHNIIILTLHHCYTLLIVDWLNTLINFFPLNSVRPLGKIIFFFFTVSLSLSLSFFLSFFLFCLPVILFLMLDNE